MDSIFYVLRTGCQWKALPREFGTASTVHDRLQLWRASGVFARRWQEGLLEYDALKGIEWEVVSYGWAMTKAPWGERPRGPIPQAGVRLGPSVPL